MAAMTHVDWGPLLAVGENPEPPEEPPLPPLVSHMVVARRTAGLIDSHVLDATSGDFLLGATTPDIRVLTRWDRARTHFFDLHNDEHQDSVQAFFAAHPHLRDAERVTQSTRAWVCGFITHIVMDEIYITEIYRPHFGPNSPLGGGERANLFDRILQYELDRREREDPQGMADLRQQLFASAIDIDTGFIDRETLEKWRDVSASVTEHAPDWERFTYIASRHLKRAGIESESDYRDFLGQVPEMLDETIRSVGMAQVEGFFERVAERTLPILREYLGCP